MSVQVILSLYHNDQSLVTTGLHMLDYLHRSA